jgi:hypothetical protein
MESQKMLALHAGRWSGFRKKERRKNNRSSFIYGTPGTPGMRMDRWIDRWTDGRMENVTDFCFVLFRFVLVWFGFLAPERFRFLSCFRHSSSSSPFFFSLSI